MKHHLSFFFMSICILPIQAQTYSIDENGNEVYMTSKGGENPSEKVSESNDFTYQKMDTETRKPVKYPTLREADVMFAKRIERIMDVREKQNSSCRGYKNPLTNLIFYAAERGQLQAYKTDSLTQVFRSDTVIKMFAIKEVIKVPDPKFEGEFIDSIIYTPYPLEDIVRWKIIEDWIFDKQSGQFYPRIVSIAPMINLKVAGQDLGEVPAFYIKWTEARKLLVNEEMFNPHNDAGSYTYYDFFERRQFASYITKEPNVLDLSFDQYEQLIGNPLAQMLESERVKKELMDFESDLWQY